VFECLFVRSASRKSAPSGCLGVLFLLLAVAACTQRAAFPAGSQSQEMPCPSSQVHALVAQGRLFSALRLARAEALEPRVTRGARPDLPAGACEDRAERAELTASVLAELGACAEARSLTPRSLDCTREALPVRDLLARAADLRRSGQTAEATRLSARALYSARAAGRRVRALPTLPKPAGGPPRELSELEDTFSDEWQDAPSVYFLAGSTCVGGSCLVPDASTVHIPGAEFVSGFAPRRLDYPWRMHPGRGLTVTPENIVDHVRHRSIPFGLPAGVVPDRFTGARLADLAFSRDGSVVWALGWPGRLFAVDARSGRALVDFDLARTCPRVREPLRLVSAASAELAIAQVGSLPGCATLVRTTSQTISALPFAAGEMLALSGNGRVVAVENQGRVTSYDLAALRWLDPPDPQSFALSDVNRLALSYDGSVVVAVVLGKVVELPNGGLDMWPNELLLLRRNGEPLPEYEAWGIGYGAILGDGDFGDRVYTLRNAIFDYQGELRAVLLARNASMLAAFADGTLEALGPAGRQLYRCAIDEARFPAEDCADAFERPGQLRALVEVRRPVASQGSRGLGGAPRIGGAPR